MRAVFIATILALLAMPSAQAVEYPSTCRGPTAVVTQLSGLNTRTAKMIAKYTLQDAIAYCEYEKCASGGVAPTRKDCATRFMREQGNVVQEARADCVAATLSTTAIGLPTPQYPQSTWTSSYTFPIPSSCGGDNTQGIAIFRILCPAYGGRVEQ
jgi:hypothetical protein